MPKTYIVVCQDELADDDLESFRMGVSLEDPDAKSVQDRTWIVDSDAAGAAAVLEDIVRRIREVRARYGPHRPLHADFYAARIDRGPRREARLVPLKPPERPKWPKPPLQPLLRCGVLSRPACGSSIRFPRPLKPSNPRSGIALSEYSLEGSP